MTMKPVERVLKDTNVKSTRCVYLQMVTAGSIVTITVGINSIYTQTYGEQQIKSVMNWRGILCMRECEHYIQPTIVMQRV
jgi:hypothetical protein